MLDAMPGFFEAACLLFGLAIVLRTGFGMIRRARTASRQHHEDTEALRRHVAYIVASREEDTAAERIPAAARALPARYRPAAVAQDGDRRLVA